MKIFASRSMRIALVTRLQSSSSSWPVRSRCALTRPTDEITFESFTSLSALAALTERAVAAATGLVAIADDSGIEVDALDGLTPAAMAQQAEQARAPRRRGVRSAQSQTCRVCGHSLGSGAERKLGRHLGCPSDYDEALPAFVIFTDPTLVAIAESVPSSEQDLLAVSGVGRTKMERYGEQLLAVVAGEDPSGMGALFAN